jgi:nicotinate (nicotinamide) nucleotide adenylyltransferase
MTTMVGEVANHIRQSAAMSSALPLPEDNIAAGLRIGVFGTSADPPHLGHMAIIEALSDSGNFDEIWVLPVYVHMMSGKNDHLSSFEHRFKMCEAAFNDSIIKSNSGCKIKVLPLERCASKAMDAIIANHAEQKRPRIGTKFIIDLIRTLYPSLTSLGLILGSDTFVDLTSGKWKDASTLLKNTALHVVSRPGKYLIHSFCHDDNTNDDLTNTAIFLCSLTIVTFATPP